MTIFKIITSFIIVLLCNIEVVYSNCESKVTILKNARIIDGTGTEPKEGWDILLCEDKILDIGPEILMPGDANIIDATGLTILPGLIDMHGHLYVNMGSSNRSGNQQAYLNLFLAGGVTTIYSPGEFDAEGTLRLQEKVNAGQLNGPEILTAGPYFGYVPTELPGKYEIITVDELESQFNLWKDRVDGIKVYTSITEGELKKVIELAKQHNLPVTGHLGSVTAASAIDLGIDGLEHGLWGMPEFFEDGITPNSTVCRDSDLDLSNPAIESLIQKIIDNNVYITPTIVTLSAMSADFVPVTEWKKYISNDARESLSMLENMMSSYKNVQNCVSNLIPKQSRFIKDINDRGGIIVTGTDPILPMITPGYGLHREMELLVKAGLSPLEAIQAATLNGAKALRKDKEIGSLEAGKRANMVVVQGDPSHNINDIGNTVMIIKHGKLFDPAELRESVLGKIGSENTD